MAVLAGIHCYASIDSAIQETGGGTRVMECEHYCSSLGDATCITAVTEPIEETHRIRLCRTEAARTSPTPPALYSWKATRMQLPPASPHGDQQPPKHRAVY